MSKEKNCVYFYCEKEQIIFFTHVKNMTGNPSHKT